MGCFRGGLDVYHALPYCQTSKPASSPTQAGVSHDVFSAILLSFMACIAKRILCVRNRRGI